MSIQYNLNIKDSGSDSEIETWSFEKAINEFQAFASEKHDPVKPLSGIVLLMESPATPLLVVPQSKLVLKYCQISPKQTDMEKLAEMIRGLCKKFCHK